MSTNREAFKRAIVSNANYKTIFRRYDLNQTEIDKLIRFLKPLYTYFVDDYIIFKYPKQTKLLKLTK